MQSIPAYLKAAAAADNARRRPRDAGDLWDDYLPGTDPSDFGDTTELREALRADCAPADVVETLVGYWCQNA